MKELSEFCKELKKDFTPRIKDTKKPVSFWSEKDILNKKVVDAFVIILRTRGCSWALKSGCSMCGYFNDSVFEDVSDYDLITQFEESGGEDLEAINSAKKQRDRIFEILKDEPAVLEELNRQKILEQQVEPAQDTAQFPDQFFIDVEASLPEGRTIDDFDTRTNDW